MRRRRRDVALVGPWRRLHGAIWLIGLAILIWQGWMWPGILVLLALSMLVEALLMRRAPQAFEQAEPAAPGSPTMSSSPTTAQPPEHRADLLPSSCPKCGAPVRGEEVKWTGARSADCSHCGANLPTRRDR